MPVFLDTVYFLQFIALIIIFFIKLGNVMSKDKLYEFTGIMLFGIGATICFGIGFTFYMASITTTAPSMEHTYLWFYEIFIYGLIFVFTVAELVMYVMKKSEEVTAAYTPRRT